MMEAARLPDFAAALPTVRGRVQAHVSLAPLTWFRAGGAAEVLVRPADADDLADFLRALPHEIPVHTIGACSNLIIRDGGLPGVTIRLARGFSAIAAEAGGIVAGAAALDVTVAEHAAAAGLTGLEFLCGIPGSIGGAVAMNAGAYGGDLAEVMVWAEIVTRTGEQRRLLGPQLAFAYRHAALPASAVVTRVLLRATPGSPALIAARMVEIRAAREASQPTRARTGGSTFRNPDGMKAWELIAGAGCRGLTRGGAQVSEKHCNFLINTSRATAADIEGLGEEVRRRVLAATGVTLEWEIRRIGIPAARPRVMPEGTPGDVLPEGTPGHVVPKGTLGHVVPEGTLGHVVPKGTLGHVVPKGTLGHVVPKDTLGDVMPEGALGHVMAASAREAGP